MLVGNSVLAQAAHHPQCRASLQLEGALCHCGRQLLAPETRVYSCRGNARPSPREDPRQPSHHAYGLDVFFSLLPAVPCCCFLLWPVSPLQGFFSLLNMSFTSVPHPVLSCGQHSCVSGILGPCLLSKLGRCRQVNRETPKEFPGT